MRYTIQREHAEVKSSQSEWFYFRYKTRGALGGSVLVPRTWYATVLDFAGAFKLLLQLIMVPDALSAVLISVASVLLYDKYGQGFSTNMNWVAVSIMLVFPISNSITNAFKRREQAIAELCTFRTQVINIFLAHAVWDWASSTGWFGRDELSSAPAGPPGQSERRIKAKGLVELNRHHQARVKALLLAIVDSLEELLLVPRRGRMRHMNGCCGTMEKDLVEKAEKHGRDLVMKLVGRLHRATEELKAAGMPGNESSRLNQYVMFLNKSFENLWAFKVYRTSASLRALSLITTQIMPMFYGPYFLHIARGEGSENNVAFACAFASLISVLLVALISLERQLENPFRFGSTDTIRVKEEMQLCRENIFICEADLESPWYQNPRSEMNFAMDNNGSFATLEMRT